MGLTKDNHYSETQLKFAILGKAIAHPARVKILELLHQEQIIRFDQLNGLLNLSTSTIRTHLEKLKICNLIQEGYIFHCSLITLNKDNIEEVKTILEMIKNGQK